MKKRLLTSIVLSIFVFCISFSFAQEITNNVKETETTNTQKEEKKENDTDEMVKEWYISAEEGEKLKLTKEELSDLNKNIWHIKLVEEIFKQQKRPLININIDKEIQEELLGSRVALSFSNREYFISSSQNIVILLENIEFLNFLKWAANFSDEPLSMRISIYTEKWIINIDYTPFKGKDVSNLGGNTLYSFYLFIKKVNGEYVVNEIDINNTATHTNDGYTMWKDNVKTETVPYLEDVEKKIPGFGWFTSTWQLFLVVLLPIDIVLTILIFGFFFKKLNKSNLPDE